MSDDSSNTTPDSVAPAAKSLSFAGVHWGPLAAILVVILSYLAAQILGSALVSLYTHTRHWSTDQATNWLQDSIAAQFGYVLLSEIITVAVLVLFLRRRRGTLQALGLTRAKGRDALYAVLGVVAYFAIFLAVVGVLKAAIHIDINQEQEIGFDHVAGTGALVMTFISLVILPPLVEETVFRGFLYSGLRKAWGMWAAVIATSLVFALPHLLEGGGQKLLWIGGVDTFVLSLVLCYLREKTGRLWASIGVHALKNGLAFLSLFILHVR